MTQVHSSDARKSRHIRTAGRVGAVQPPHGKEHRVRRGVRAARHLIAAWREAKVFTAAERAALELTEQGTRIADAAGGATDEAWANAADTTTRTGWPHGCP